MLKSFKMFFFNISILWLNERIAAPPARTKTKTRKCHGFCMTDNSSLRS